MPYVLAAFWLEKVRQVAAEEGSVMPCASSACTDQCLGCCAMGAAPLTRLTLWHPVVQQLQALG